MFWTTEKDNELAALYKAGVTNVDIGIAMGVTTKAVERRVAKIRKTHGLVGRPRKYSSAEEARRAVNKQARERYVSQKKERKRRTDNPVYRMWSGAKKRAREGDLPFDIDLGDIHIPDTCPLLGIPIHRGENHWTNNSPTLDRIVPAKGYTKGNVMVISFRANRIKCDASVEELETISKNLREVVDGA